MSHEVLGNGCPARCVVFVSSFPLFSFFSQMVVFVLLDWSLSSSLIAGGSGCSLSGQMQEGFRTVDWVLSPVIP